MMVAMKHIFLAEDDIDDVDLFQEALSEECSTCSLTVGKNGTELLKKLAESTLPDLIFLDINMPIMNGLECLAEIKKIPHLQHIPVIMLTTSCPKECMDTAYSLGANMIVEKPSQFEILKKIIHYALTHEWNS
jgi:CheY-like chemotaxis protein